MLLKLFITCTIFLFNPLNVEYDIVEIYKSIVPEIETVVLTKFNNVEDVELILIPIRIDPGNYTVKVTRKAKDLYNVDGLNIFIKTRSCTKFSVNANAVVRISASGDSKGKIIFSD